jgi:hypothetical protein
MAKLNFADIEEGDQADAMLLNTTALGTIRRHVASWPRTLRPGH